MVLFWFSSEIKYIFINNIDKSFGPNFSRMVTFMKNNILFEYIRDNYKVK